MRRGDGEYQVMRWDGGFDGPWSSDAVEKYRKGGFDGLSLTPGGGWVPQDLRLVNDLPNLRYFHLRARLSNDLAVFGVDTLEELALATGSRRVVPKVVQPALRRLILTDRPGIDVARKWPMLEEIRVGRWRGSDLRMVCGAERLSVVRVEGRRQTGSLAGVESCRSVTDFMSVDYTLTDTAPLRSLVSLRDVRLLAAQPAAPHRRVSFADLAGPDVVRIWISNAADLQDLEAPAAMPRLRELRIIECPISARDNEILHALPDRIRVERVDVRPGP